MAAPSLDTLAFARYSAQLARCFPDRLLPKAGRIAFEHRFHPLVPGTFLSSVVAEELYAGALDLASTRLVERYVEGLQKSGRLITPTFADWSAAGKLVARIAQ